MQSVGLDAQDYFSGPGLFEELCSVSMPMCSIDERGQKMRGVHGQPFHDETRFPFHKYPFQNVWTLQIY